MHNPKVLSVGQCGIDHPAISKFLGEAINAQVDPADSADEALVALKSAPAKYDLVLVNRVFDRGGSGLDLIRTIRQDSTLAEVPLMLVSNLADAQQQAVEAGARPGFGKSEIGDEAIADRLKAALSGSDNG